MKKNDPWLLLNSVSQIMNDLASWSLWLRILILPHLAESHGENTCPLLQFPVWKVRNTRQLTQFLWLCNLITYIITAAKIQITFSFIRIVIAVKTLYLQSSSFCVYLITVLQHNAFVKSPWSLEFLGYKMCEYSPVPIAGRCKNAIFLFEHYIINIIPGLVCLIYILVIMKNISGSNLNHFVFKHWFYKM